MIVVTPNIKNKEPYLYGSLLKDVACYECDAASPAHDDGSNHGHGGAYHCCYDYYYYEL